MAIPKWIVFILKGLYVCLKFIFEHAQKFYSLLAIAAIVVAGVWGWSTFQYLHLRSSTLHVSPEIELKIGESRKGRIPILADISIENTGKREAHIFPGLFFAKGIIYEDRWFDDAEFQKNLDELEPDQFIDRLPGTPTLVASGSLYVGKSLKPGETVHRSAIFYVPENYYDSITVWAEFLTVNESKAIKVEYGFNVKKMNIRSYVAMQKIKKKNVVKICVKNIKMSSNITVSLCEKRYG